MKYINKKLFSLAFLALSSYGLAEDYVSEDYCFNPCDDVCSQWYVTADFIYWKAHENNLEYAYDGAGVLGALPSSGSSKELDWNWDPGFKVGVGYVLGNSNWDFYLNYTWYYTSANASASDPSALGTPALGLFPTFTSFFDPSVIPLLSASSDWHLHYQTLDFEIGNWICINSNFSFRPNFGLRAAWTRDRDLLNYVYPLAPLSITTFNYRQKFDGVGPRLGLNAQWSFFKDWFAFADGALALVWGRYNISVDDTAFFGEIHTTNSFYTIRTLTDLKVGIGWEHLFCNNYLFSLQLAWEHRLWFKHNEYQRFNTFFTLDYRNNDGDLGLYGLTLTACLKF